MVEKAYEKIVSRWRTYLFANILEPKIDISNSMDIYLFGVFAGQSTIEWLLALEAKGIEYDRILLFDSFQGIPRESAEKVRPLWDPDRSDFFGAFNASKYWGTLSTEETIDRFKEKVNSFIGDKELIFIPDFFENSLTDDLVSRIKPRPAFFVDIDVDIYTSTKQALTWLMRHDLLAPGKSIVGYDDWSGEPDYRNARGGEARAHRETSEEFNSSCEEIAHIQGRGQVVFRYLGKQNKGSL